MNSETDLPIFLSSVWEAKKDAVAAVCVQGVDG